MAKGIAARSPLSQAERGSSGSGSFWRCSGVEVSPNQTTRWQPASASHSTTCNSSQRRPLGPRARGAERREQPENHRRARVLQFAQPGPAPESRARRGAPPVDRSSCSRARTMSSRPPVAGEHVLDERREDGVVHRRELYQARMQTLQLCLRERVEIHARWVVLAGPLQPAQQDLGVPGRGHGTLAQPRSIAASVGARVYGRLRGGRRSTLIPPRAI
jgi:hypothetical protein